MNRLRVTIGVLTALVLLAGCSDGGKNAPLPRASKARTMAYATGVGNALGAAVGAPVRVDREDGGFAACLGRNDEVPTDARYELTYYAHIPVPAARQPAAARAMRGYLTAHGYKVVGELPAGDAALGMPLDTEKGDWSVSLDSTIVPKGSPGEIAVGVFSPCYLPPGAVQKAQD